MPVPCAKFGEGAGGSDPNIGWYPPGHGDVYESLERCGLLENLIQSGKEYAFISNVDNLGATVDLRILFHVMSGMGSFSGTEGQGTESDVTDIEFCMEVTKRTRADVVGGTLVQYETNSDNNYNNLNNFSGFSFLFLPLSLSLFLSLFWKFNDLHSIYPLLFIDQTLKKITISYT